MNPTEQTVLLDASRLYHFLYEAFHLGVKYIQQSGFWEVVLKK